MKRTMRLSRLIASMLAAVSVIVVHSPVPAAQPATIKPGSHDDLRAVYAGAVEVAEGKRVAETACSRCHGMNGVSKTKGIPHIAGQRAAYLYSAVRSYHDSVRGQPAMGEAVKFLSDDALVKVAAYYASLDPAESAGGAKAAAPAPDPVAAGKAAAAACGGCHGDIGISKTPGTPSLVGLDPKYLVGALLAYRNGQRKSDIMKSLVAALSDADMKNIALFYALQKPARAPTPAAGNSAAGKTAAAACAGCHGERGASGSPANPSLAGQDAQYLAGALRAYKTAARAEATMKSIAATLDDRTMNDLAAYYAAQQPQALNVRKPLSTTEWAQRCDRCHGVNGNSSDPRIPELAAQRPEYLEQALRAYRTGKRKNPLMTPMSEGLTDADIENLAAHYGRQKARAVVYVMVPAR